MVRFRNGDDHIEAINPIEQRIPIQTKYAIVIRHRVRYQVLKDGELVVQVVRNLDLLKKDNNKSGIS